MPARLLPAILAVAAVLGLVPAIGLSGCGSSRPSSATGPLSAPSAGAPMASGFDGALLPGSGVAHEFTLSEDAPGDAGGRPVSLRDYRGRVTILAFLYTGCRSACVLIAQQIRGALDELGSDVPALIVSVDPAGDTPARVHRFLERVSLSGRATYLTGPRARLAPVWRAYGIVPASAGEAAFARVASVFLLDRDGRERVVFQQEQLTPEALAHDVRKLQSG